MMRRVVATAAILATVGGAVLAAPTTASACGGCFAPTETQQVVTDHRMVMAVHATESILWDQIRYSGAPEDFSWVLPVQGDVRIELASGNFFDALDASTAVTVRGPSVNISCNSGGFLAGASSAPNAAEDRSGDPVQVIHEEVVGPYQTVTLRSTDAGALETWLRSNNYSIPQSIEPIIQWYTDLHMDFVALRLRPGQGVAAMQPVRIRYATANMVLPLRMVAAGIADKVGITLWVFGNGRFEAQNFSNGTINADELVWNWDTSRSNYPTVFDNTLQRLGGRAWITEYAMSAENLRYRLAYDSTTGQPADMTDWNLATSNNATGTWISRLRTDLAAAFLSTDLVLQASASNSPVNNFLNATHETGTRPVARCPTGTVVSVGGGSALACSASPGRRSSTRPGTYVTFGVLAAALGVSVARRRRNRRSAD